MKARIYKSIDIDTEVDVDVDDITCALKESIESASKLQRSGATPRQKTFATGQVVTAAYQCLKAITNEMIADFPEKTRLSIARSLQEQVDRWESDIEHILEQMDFNWGDTKLAAHDAALKFDQLRSVDLPPDVSEALENFKLAIIRNRACKWELIDHSRMVMVLEALLAFGCWEGDA